MMSLLRGVFRRTPRCDHQFGEWKFYRSRVTGWMQIRYCSACKACQRKAVDLSRLRHA